MTTDIAHFESMLHPVEPAHFFDTHWEREPLHVQRKDAAFYEKLLSIADLEQIIESPNSRYPTIQLSKNGAYFPADVYSDDQQFGGARFTGIPNVQRIAAEYRAGATIVLPALHRTWSPLRTLCGNIEAELDHVAHANAYLTPGNAAGFTPHYDTHEVLVLQIAGHKHWRIYEGPTELPHRKQPFTPSGYVLPSKPLLEVTLSAGDLLYLPRGYIHTTTTSDRRSAHITIGIAVYTWIDLASEMLQAAMESPQLRRALPPGFASRGAVKPALMAELARVLDQLHGAADSEELVDLFLSRVRSTKTPERGSFRSDVTVIEPHTQLQAPDPELYRIVPQGSKLAVEFKQRRFILPAEAHAALEGMRQQRVFQTADLPGGLSLDAKLTLVRTLFDKGFISKRS
jgi:ribosomal protein L16 Arg81 hydroxylase